MRQVHTTGNRSTVYITRLKPLNLYSSIFKDPAKKPVQKLFREALDDTYDYWSDIRDYVFENRPGAEELWYFYPKVGWHIRIRYNKRVIVYCIPCERFFAILLVLGEKAVREAFSSSISTTAKQWIQEAGAHTEGRSCYIKIDNNRFVKDIKKLLAIKLFVKS